MIILFLKILNGVGKMQEYKKRIFEVAQEFDFTKEELTDLYTTYLLDIPEYINRIEVLQREELWGELQLAIHTIKGMTANLRLDDVFRESSKLNKYLKEGNIPSVIAIKAYIELLKESNRKINCLFSGEYFINK
jgi:HPt (histidine-containing phosphotransfer) domain-containing protein